MNIISKISWVVYLDLRIGLNLMLCLYFKDRNFCVLNKYNLNAFRIVNSFNIVMVFCYILVFKEGKL